MSTRERSPIYVTPAELQQLERRLEENFNRIFDRLTAIEDRLGAWGRWFRARLTTLVDGLLGKFGVAAVAFTAAYFLFH